jgi:hypothetical protein
MRERIRDVMSYAGPRMVYRHPIMTIGHMLDGLRQEPVATAGRRSSPDDRKKKPGTHEYETKDKGVVCKEDMKCT